MDLVVPQARDERFPLLFYQETVDSPVTPSMSCCGGTSSTIPKMTGSIADRQQKTTKITDKQLYAGVHFPVDLDEGLKLGRQIGHIVVQTIQNEEDSAHKPIDVHFTKDLHANLPPPPYVQAIPFHFDQTCQSKVRPWPTTHHHPHP
jgi:hypothetical protein